MQVGHWRCAWVVAFVILLGGTESVIGQDQGPVSDASEQGLPSGLTITGIPQGQKVGRFAESDRYMLSGIQSFTTFEVFRHLQRDPAVFLARDSGASLSDLVSVIRRKISAEPKPVRGRRRSRR